MAFPILETPRTEAGDQTRLTQIPDFDAPTENSIPSPSKEGNDLLTQLRGTRIPQGRTPIGRQPFADRRNVNKRPEFTPLLKSATRNRQKNLPFSSQDDKVRTPAGLKASYRSNSPALPFNSSIILEEHTGSSIGAQETTDTPMVPYSSSSAMSTPMIPIRRGDGPLDRGGNLATLREQEARLEQIDKENFSLKLKIHFMEEALRRNGKDFNESAVRENTELKVDKVTLQRDLKHHRKQLAQAERDLEDYKRQLLEYAEKVKRRHATEGQQEELDQLRQALQLKEAEIQKLQVNQGSPQNDTEELERLRDELSDLEADLRERDRQLEEKDDQLDAARQNPANQDDDLRRELADTKSLLEEKEENIQALQDALRRAGSESDRRLDEKDRLLEQKDDELKDLEDQLKTTGHDQSFNNRNKDQQLQHHVEDIQILQTKLTDAEHVAASKTKEAAEISADSRKHARDIEDKDHQIHTLEQKLHSVQDRDEQAEKLSDDIHDLEASLREKERLVEEKDILLEDMEEELQRVQKDCDEEIHRAQRDCDEELKAAEDRIQELETKESQLDKEIEELRLKAPIARNDSDVDLEAAREELGSIRVQYESQREHEKHLQADINRLKSNIVSLEDGKEDLERYHDSEKTTWETELRSIQAAKSKVEDEADNLRSTIDKVEEEITNLRRSMKQLQEAGGTLSGRETQLNKLLEVEQERYQSLDTTTQDQLRAVRSSKQAVDEELDQANQKLHQTNSEVKSLQEEVQSLEDEIEVLQTSLDEADDKTVDELAASKQEAEGLRRQIRGLQQDLAQTQSALTEAQTTPTQTTELQNRVHDLAQQLRNANNDLQSAKDALATSNHELSSLTQAHSTTQQQILSLRQQLMTQERTASHTLQAQISAYEHDIANLESDLSASQATHTALQHKATTAEHTTTRLRARLATLESQPAPAPDASERRDLHALLKTSTLSLEAHAAALRTRDAADAKTRRRHALELRGLVKQIEYLAARLRREEGLRAALAHAKRFMQATVAMHARSSALNAGLVREMGISGHEVRRRMDGEEKRSLRVVGLMVLAGVRMKRGVLEWQSVRRGREELLKGLKEMKERRKRKA